MSKVEFSQSLVDEYINNWIGVSIYNTEDYNVGPSVLGLYFPSDNIATKGYIFLKEWKNWLPNQNLIFSVVKENDTTFSFYFYKEQRVEFIKGTFQDNLILDELETFIINDRERKIVIVARFPNENNDIIDYPHQDVIILDGFKFLERNDVESNSMEDN